MSLLVIPSTIRVDVNIPALDNYVNLLREQDQMKKSLDAAAETIRDLTGRLKTSSATLAADVTAETK